MASDIYILLVWISSIVLTLFFDRMKAFYHKTVTFSSPKRESGVALVLILIGVSILVIAFSLPSIPATSTRNTYTISRLVLQLLISGIFVLPFVTILRLRHQSFTTMGVSRYNVRNSSVLGVLMGVVASLLLGQGALVSSGASIFGLYSFLGFLSVGFVEEAVFRGYTQTRFIAWLGQRKGWAVTSLVFALYHIPQRIFVERQELFSITIGLITLFITGLLFGWIMQKTQNIVTPALLHTFLDWAGSL